MLWTLFVVLGILGFWVSRWWYWSLILSAGAEAQFEKRFRRRYGSWISGFRNPAWLATSFSQSLDDLAAWGPGLSNRLARLAGQGHWEE
jgi:hypothetical protein